MDSGELEPWEVDIMKRLLDLEERGLKELRGLAYVRSVRYGGLLVVVLRGGQLTDSLTKRLAKELSEELSTRVKVLEYSADVRRLATQLLYPARVLGVNIVWLPDGTQLYSVRIPRSDERLFPVEREGVEEILSRLTGHNVVVRLE